MATILDVARLAGVSQGTVSNVLNGKGNVSSEKIRSQDIQLMKEQGYYVKEREKLQELFFLQLNHGSIVNSIIV